MINKEEALNEKYVDKDVRDSIYDKTFNIRCFASKIRKSRITNINKKITDKQMVGWCYQLCFVLAPLYEKSILNRGIIYIPEPYLHCWLNIYEKGEWYIFDPCFNICCKKEDYEKFYKPVINVSFNGEDIRRFLFDNIDVDMPFGLKKGKIISSKNINDISYGNSIKYILNTDKIKIKTIKVKYI